MKTTAATFRTMLHFVCVSVLLFSQLPAAAQLLNNSEDKPEEPVAEVVYDSLGRSTPRGTINGFIKAVADQNYTRAAAYLQFSRSLRSQKEKVVGTFQKLLDQGGNIMPYSWISNKNTGRTDDELPAGVDLVGTVTANGETINLFVENREADDTPPIWRFSTETVEKIAAVSTEQTFLDKILPELLKDKKLAGVPLGHWLSVVVLILFAYLVCWAAIALLCFLIHKLWIRDPKSHASAIVKALNLPLRLYMSVWVFVALSKQAGISIIVRQRFSSIIVIIGLVAIIVLLWRMSDFAGSYTQQKLTKRGRISAISIVLFLKRTAKVAIIVLGTIAILGTIGIDVTAGLAALGIGGIALALGAQKTVENFVGSVMIIADQPIRVGDYCKVGDITGSVEQIGMRSTVLRTGERSLVTIPNGDLAASRIENYAYRDRFLFNPVFGFRPETTPDQLRFLLVEIRSLLYAHPMVDPDPAKVRFTKWDSTGPKIELWSYINAPNFDVSQEIQEDLLLRIMDIVGRSGTALGLPSQTLYFSKDSGLAAEKQSEAEQTVKKWTADKALQLPNFDAQRIAELKNTIDYPAEGSVTAKPAK